MTYLVHPSSITGGTLTVPGDKSISHRALMLAAIADGTSRVSGFLPGEDCLATMAALRAMGIQIDHPAPTEVTVEGQGLHGLSRPARDLDLGNSGTAMRLFTGLLAGQKFDTRLTGDESLQSRPMRRVILPLSEMGAAIEGCGGTPPLDIHGGLNLRGIHYDLPVASAQVKSAILLCGLYAQGETCVTEPAITRDHSERMLKSMGVEVRVSDKKICMAGGQQPKAIDIHVPADLSSAAFPLVAALLAEDAELTITNVGLNPTRTGILTILRQMGANISISNETMAGAEPVGDVTVRSSKLTAIDVDPAQVSLAIDEFPLIFIAAAAAEGRTTFSGLEELRVKESDRIASMAAGLKTLGIGVEETPDGAHIQGGTMNDGKIDSFGDHRVAMAFAVAGTIARGPVTIANTEAVDTSFPGFVGTMRACGCDIAEADSG